MYIQKDGELHVCHWLVPGNVKNSRLKMLVDTVRIKSANLKNKSFVLECFFDVHVGGGRRLPYVL